MLAMIISGFVAVVGTGGIVQSADAVEEDDSSHSVSALPAGLRQGEYNLDDSPPEYMAYGSGSSRYFGTSMTKVDINGDGTTDMIVGQYNRGGLAIYDGNTDLTFPKLSLDETEGRWHLSGSTYFGHDVDVGDVNG
ncbi:MAG: VCBS repeat-containing protein, partial [Candidatus Thermoplasmatota archaeon]|nr:VCBS repeat-containing protein [Candidatus Thermoplasmatota archaeon]